MKSTVFSSLYQQGKVPHIVIIGGGFGGLTLLKKLANTNCKVTLIDKNNFHTFQPLLYQVATASLSADSIGYPFRRTVGAIKNLSFIMAEVRSINQEENCVVTSEGDLTYDFLVIATGSKTNFFGNNQLAKLAMQLKTISQALDIRTVFLQEFEKAVRLSEKHDSESVKKVLNFVIVGAGPTGVEVAGALAEIKKKILIKEYKEIDASLMQITLIDAGSCVLNVMSEKSSQRAEKYLQEMGVNILLNTLVTSYDGEKIVLKNGKELLTNTVIWSAGVMGNPILGLQPDVYLPNGRIKVNVFNVVEGTKNIAALGDIAQMQNNAYPHGHPMVAQPAIQQATNLARNILMGEKDKSPKKFTYKDKGSLATIGRNKAVADLGNISLGGWLAWYVWMLVHVMFLIGFRNKIAVLFNWAVKYFSYKNTIRLIVRPFVRGN